MSKTKARVFVPLTKVDEDKRLVYGRITQEMLDKSGEVMDYDSSKPFFEKWSKEIHEASGGLSKGNVRVMHGLSVAGKLTELEFDDVDRAIDVCAKVVDDTQWNMVLEGCYTGFSVGGSYAKRWTETGNDNTKVRKYTANPNEVSLVDNPCVPSATFALVKADGAEELVNFKIENDDDQWPDFAKVETDIPGNNPEIQSSPVISTEPSNTDIVAKAEELAKAANDGSNWVAHVEAARLELLKVTPTEEKEDDSTQEDIEGIGEITAEDNPEAGKSEKVTPPGVKQVWTASDGKTFEKKVDAENHEASLKSETPEITEADRLRERMSKALTPSISEPHLPLMEDYDRLGKAIQAIETPFDLEKGQPILEKGMYTVSRFANVLWDLGSLARKIAKEGINEGGADGDPSDKQVSLEIKEALTSLGESFKAYASNQLVELLAGIDDNVQVAVYDYYYNAAKDNSEDQLAKDVCELIDSHKEVRDNRREELVKIFTPESSPVELMDEDSLSPQLKKRFDKLVADNESLIKVANEAVEKVEDLAKRLQVIEDTPLPRATAHVALRGEDHSSFLKGNTEEEKLKELHNLLKTEGPESVALKMIKLSHSSGGHRIGG